MEILLILRLASFHTDNRNKWRWCDRKHSNRDYRIIGTRPVEGRRQKSH